MDKALIGLLMMSAAQQPSAAPVSEPVDLVLLALTDQQVDLLWACVRYVKRTLQTDHGDPCEDLHQLERFLMRAES